MNSPLPSGPRGWIETLHAHVEGEGKRFELGSLVPGDILRVITHHTMYTFVMTGPRAANLETDREDRPNGPVLLMGCTFGQSSTISPDYIFCGGNLEFTHGGGSMTCTTTAIRAIQLIGRSPSP